LQQSQEKPFDLVVDLTCFSDENEIQAQWLSEFSKLVPSELVNSLGKIYLLNPNTSFKKYCKVIHRFTSHGLTKKTQIVTNLADLNDFISPMELRLPGITRKCYWHIDAANLFN
jgi:hypothetical protein